MSSQNSQVPFQEWSFDYFHFLLKMSESNLTYDRKFRPNNKVFIFKWDGGGIK